MIYKENKKTGKQIQQQSLYRSFLVQRSQFVTLDIRGLTKSNGIPLKKWNSIQTYHEKLSTCFFKFVECVDVGGAEGFLPNSDFIHFAV